ncbi:MAG TPA: tRNA uridine-5-carboxymethylaminomethyl(34) synthesis GTPase MnmE [Chitinophagaceae bacterium]|nr:tRNA uridine-5-carboxymethylaminomethyl(34) synthesis GTPase MnmE [Chitinophagaceae bacterium]
MHGKLSGWSDTIAAVATPPGVAAIGVLRVSGEKSFEIINKLFPSKNLADQPANTLHVGYIKDDDEILDEVVISIFKNPLSYTGEDVVEISCHGSPYVQQKVLNSIIGKGARLAKPGEFTQRAFLNGKLDLTEAEAVADLIESNTSASQNAALKNMRGGFSKILKDLRERLIQFSALIELELDFSEEDVEFADRQKFNDLLNELESTVHNLLQSFQLGNVIKNGVSVAIVGSPNAGKSTLLNTLLNDNRAIVSEIAGTTRDTIEEIININGILFRLIDTAGIREHSLDVIENMGVIKSKEKIKQADIVLYLYDINDVTQEQLFNIMSDIKKQNQNVIPVANKIDDSSEKFLLQQKKSLADSIFISAKIKTGIEELRKRLFVIATGDKSLTENIIVTNARHYSALHEVMTSLKEVRKGIDDKISGDFLSLDIRRCLHYLGEITGEVTNEDMLDYIFSKFCIGK